MPKMILLAIIGIAILPTVLANDCTGLPPDNIFQITLQNFIIRQNTPGEGSTDVNLINSSIVCLAQGTTDGTYRELSAIVEFTLDSSNPPHSVTYRRYLDLRCAVDGGSNVQYDLFGTPSLNDLRVAPANYTNISQRIDCSSCNNGGGDNNCIDCDSACNVDLMRCIGDTAGDCCRGFENDNARTCTDDCSGSGVNFVPDPDNMFVCACRFNSDNCGSGYLLNATACTCTLTDICMTEQSLCKNNGTCILGSTPDNYTCNCTGTGFTGPNCTDLVLDLMSSSAAIINSPNTSLVVMSSTPMFVASSVTAILHQTSTVLPITPTQPTLTKSLTSSISSIQLPVTSTITNENTPVAKDTKKTNIIAVLISIILVLLLLVIFITLIMYVIYVVLVSKNDMNPVPSSKVYFDNGKAYNNPLYINPEEVTGAFQPT